MVPNPFGFKTQRVHHPRKKAQMAKETSVKRCLKNTNSARVLPLYDSFTKNINKIDR